MSEEMAKKKREDETKLEEEAKLSKQDMVDMRQDICPVCGQPTLTFPYVNGTLFQMFYLLECPFCGTVFCPTSIRKKKMSMSGNTVQTPPGIVLASG